MPDDAIDDAVISAFLVKHVRSRYRARLSNPKTRWKLIYSNDWCHRMPIIEQYATKIEPDQQYEEEIEQVLRAKGAPDNAYLIGGEFDGQTVPLRQALDDLVPEGVGFISCIPGRLAYYGGEDFGERYILERR